MSRWTSRIVLAVLAAASLALAAAFLRPDLTADFGQRCTSRGGHVITERPQKHLVEPGAHGPVPIGYPTTQKCIGPEGEVFGVR